MAFVSWADAGLHGHRGADSRPADRRQHRGVPDSYRDFSYPLYVDLRDSGAIFESVMAHTLGLVGIREGETTRRSFAEIVSSN
jgi:hypothetical protein